VVTVWESSKSPGIDTPADASLCCQQLNTPQAPVEIISNYFLKLPHKSFFYPKSSLLNSRGATHIVNYQEIKVLPCASTFLKIIFYLQFL
jgi:hypothetical protein